MLDLGLVHIMHQSFVTGGRAGDSSGNEVGFDQSFATTVRGTYPEFALYRLLCMTVTC